MLWRYALTLTCGHMANSIVGIADEGSRTPRVLTDHRGSWGNGAPVALGSTWPPCSGNGASISATLSIVKGFLKVCDDPLTMR